MGKEELLPLHMRCLTLHPVMLGHTLKAGNRKVVSKAQCAPLGVILKPSRRQDMGLILLKMLIAVQYKGALPGPIQNWLEALHT